MCIWLLRRDSFLSRGCGVDVLTRGKGSILIYEHKYLAKALVYVEVSSLQLESSIYLVLTLYIMSVM